MEEDEVKAKLPEVYQSVIKCEEDVDWAQIKEDLEDLNWLDLDNQLAYDLIVSVWKVADRWSVSVLQSTPRFRIFKITKVKLPITNFVYNIQNTSEIQQICRESKVKIEQMVFFSCAKSMLYQAAEEELYNVALRVYDIFIEFKNNLSAFFIHFDKQLKMELNTTIGRLLDEIFYNKVVLGLRPKLIEDLSTKKIITELEKSGPMAQDIETNADLRNIITQAPTIVTYNSNFSYSANSTNSMYLRENIYRGEVEGSKRNGYGKITYFGGDSYEGYWDNDRPHGEGLYVWKVGGKYLGNFKNGVITGIGKRIYPSGNWYSGEFLNGKKHGKGEMMYKNGDIYEGEWEEDYLHGHGKYTWNTGDYFVGKFIKDLREGLGILTTIDGKIIEGEWKDNTLIGN
jgi:hypothetical protein